MAELADAPLLAVRDLSVAFSSVDGPVRVLDRVTFDVAAGETVGLVGESGSGKSVTSLAVMRLLPSLKASVTAGRVELAGRDLLALSRREMNDVRGRDVAMVFQEPMTSLDPAFKVGAQIAETVRRHAGASRRAARDRAIEVLDLVGIAQPARVADSYPHQLSGGMRQRALIAMSVACEPQLLIADEPTTALDVTVQAQVLDVLRATQQRMGMGILFITHDLGVVADLCDRIVVMYAGQVVETGTVDEVFGSPVHPYTEGLLRSRPEIDGPVRPLVPIPGSPPSPAGWPAGCRFHPRCPYAIDRCRTEPIELDVIGGAPADGTSYGPRSTRCVRVGQLDLEGAR